MSDTTASSVASRSAVRIRRGRCVPVVVIAVLAAACLALSVVVPGVADAEELRQRDIPRLAPGLKNKVSATFKDKVFHRPTARMTRIRARAASTAYYTPAGERIVLEVSPAYAPNPAADQALVNFLGSLLHSEELQFLDVVVATPEEIASICGAGVAACYSDQLGTMLVPGEDMPGLPIEYPITHELGHHIASWREDGPWPAADFGPRYWASYNYVCAYVGQGRLVPRGEGDDNWKDPAEGWAESYALYHFPGFRPWPYSDVLLPDSRTNGLVWKDVVRPWSSRGKLRRYRGRLSAPRRTRTFRVRLRLDGDISIRLRGPRRSNYNVELRYGRSLEARTRRRGSLDRLRFTWCRDNPSEVAKITVRRKSGSGRFRLDVRYSG